MGGGYNCKTGEPVTILGHIHACPTRFLAQKTFVIFKKRWPNKNLFLGRPACMYVVCTVLVYEIANTVPDGWSPSPVHFINKTGDELFLFIPQVPTVRILIVPMLPGQKRKLDLGTAGCDARQSSCTRCSTSSALEPLLPPTYIVALFPVF